MASRNIGAALAAAVLAWVAALLLTSAPAPAASTPFAETVALSELSGAQPDAITPATKIASTTEVSESPTSVDYGNEASVEFTVRVKGSTTGETAKVEVGTAECTATLTAEVGSCSIGNHVLEASPGVTRYSVHARYEGDANVEKSEATAPTGLQVTGGRVTVKVSVSPSAEVTYGDESAVEFRAEVTAENNTPLPSGESAKIRIGSEDTCTVTLSGGETSKGTCKIADTALQAASYPLSAEYEGDQNLSGPATSKNSLSLVVRPESTTFKIKINGAESSASINAGSTAKLEESGLPSGAAGKVKFVSGPTTLCELTLPATSCTTSPSLAADSYAGISATFTQDPDTNYASSTITSGLSLTVNGASASFKIKVGGSVSPSPITYGTSAKLEESELPAGAEGTITFSSGSTVLCSFSTPAGSSCTLTPGAGLYTITAKFEPAEGSPYNNSTASNSVTLQVETAATSFTITIGGASSADLSYGSSATLAESGLPVGAAGVVTFTSGSTTLCTATLPGAGTCATSTELAPGSYSPITATFTDSDGNYAGSASTGSATLTLARVASVVTITSSPSPSTPYTSLTLTATVAAGTSVPRAATGTVTFMSGAHTLGTGTLDAQGVATLRTSAPAPGAYYASAVYGGDGVYQAGQSPTIIQSVRETFAGLFELTAAYVHGSSAYRRLAAKKRVVADAQLAAIDRLLTLAAEKPSKSVLAATIYDTDVISAKGSGLLSGAQAESLITLADALPAPKLVAVTATGGTLKGHAPSVGTIQTAGSELTLRRFKGKHGNNYLLVIRTRTRGHEQTLLSRALKIA